MIELPINKIVQGDALNVLKTFPSNSIDMVMCSPPYWALRDYGVSGQLGLEPTFEEYIKKLCDIFDEIKITLKKTGTCWVNLGDTYFGSGKGAGGEIEGSKQVWTFENKTNKICKNCNKEFQGYAFQNFCGSSCSGVDNIPRIEKGILPNKTLTMIPFRFAIEMVNRGWIIRNIIIWHKPNAMPSSVRDRFTVDFEYLFFFVKSKKYYFETQYEPHNPKYIYDHNSKKERKGVNYNLSAKDRKTEGRNRSEFYSNLGRNKRTVWIINTIPFKGEHFASYPEELCVIPIEAGCPEFVCNKCGKARENIIKSLGTGMDYSNSSGYERQIPDMTVRHSKLKLTAKKEYLGLTDCNCNAGFSGGIVLDPFIGSGTTGLVALKSNRKFIGIELNPEYIKIANKRLEPYLTQTKLEVKI